MHSIGSSAADGSDKWFLHVHLWDPHTPYNTPDEYGNPFEGEPGPAWHTEEVRARNWSLAGPHSAQEPGGFQSDESRRPPSRHPRTLASMDDVRLIFDGYDVGIRYADDAVATLVSKLTDLGVVDETAIWVSSDHGEAFGELGVYADHQAADEATAHIPAVLVWPGLPAGVQQGLHYHLDVAATVARPCRRGPARPLGRGVHAVGPGVRCGVERTRGALLEPGSLVVPEGVLVSGRGSTCEPSTTATTRTGRTRCSSISATTRTSSVTSPARSRPSSTERVPSWRTGRQTQLSRSLSPIDPLDTVLGEGGPMHVRGHLRAYLERLERTGRSQWVEPLTVRHPAEAAAEAKTVPWF